MKNTEHGLKYTRDWHREDISVTIGSTAVVGGGRFLLAAGPCAVESAEQMTAITTYLKGSPIRLLRGGAFKPRTSPYSFQGLGASALKLLRETADELGIPFVTEVTDARHLDTIAAHADAVQIGSRNMSSYELLKAVGNLDIPVILKRGMSATVDEFLYAIEYVAHEGNHQIILCERGIRSFDPAFRNILDLNAVAFLKQRSPFPVIVDPSHGTGRADMILPLSLAALAAGADGVMVETHPNPRQALSDGGQSLDPASLKTWYNQIINLARQLGRTT